MVSWIKHSVDRFVIVSIFIPKLRLILILNSFLGSSDSLVFSELFHSLAPRPLAARSISRSEERFSRNAETLFRSNSFLGSSDSLVFSELFHSLAPRPLAARSISDFLLTYLATYKPTAI